MRTKQLGKGLVKTSLWGAATYGTFVGGVALERLGLKIGTMPVDPYLAPIMFMVGIAVSTAGRVVKYGTVVPAVGIAFGGLDVVAGVVRKEDGEEEAE